MTMTATAAPVAYEYAKGDDTRALRQAMGRFATGVTVVTTMVDGTPVGVTANSFTSVSLDPALVLFCLGKSLGCVDAFIEAEHFAINVLKCEQKAVSARFATRGIDRFDGTDWQLSSHDVPLLSNTLATIECANHNRIDCGDHTIFIGEVLRATYDPDHDPLLYFGGDYRQLCEG